MARVNAYVPDKLMAEFRSVAPRMPLSSLLQAAMRQEIDRYRSDDNLDAFMRRAIAGSATGSTLSK